MKKMTTCVAIATFLACAFTATEANAGANFGTETVRFSDLDTANAHSAAAIYQRIRDAAERVCADMPTAGSLQIVARHKNCVDRAIADAVVKVRLPTLTAFAAVRGGVPANAAISIARTN